MNEESILKAIEALAERVQSLESRSGSNLFSLDKEHDRVIKAMEVIQLTYSAHQTWSQQDRDRFKELKSRRNELRQILGLKY